MTSIGVGARSTKQREALVHVLDGVDGFRTAQQLHAHPRRARRQGRNRDGLPLVAAARRRGSGGHHPQRRGRGVVPALLDPSPSPPGVPGVRAGGRGSGPGGRDLGGRDGGRARVQRREPRPGDLRHLLRLRLLTSPRAAGWWGGADAGVRGLGCSGVGWHGRCNGVGAGAGVRGLGCSGVGWHGRCNGVGAGVRGLGCSGVGWHGRCIGVGAGAGVRGLGCSGVGWHGRCIGVGAGVRGLGCSGVGWHGRCGGLVLMSVGWAAPASDGTDVVVAPRQAGCCLVLV